MFKIQRMAYLCLFVSLSIFANSQSIVSDFSLTKDEATLSTKDGQYSYLVEITGPNSYYYSEIIEQTNEIKISAHKADGSLFSNGLYAMQVTPYLQLSENLQSEMVEIRNSGDASRLAEFTTQHNIPTSLTGMNVNFSINDGKFVVDNNQEVDFSSVTKRKEGAIVHPELYASLNYVAADVKENSALDNWFSEDDDQVFVDDVIVDGSICIGIDCVNGENFGFDTQRLKENNLRIHFFDTSSSASFPSNDWRIIINDSSNGGASHFTISDASASNDVLKIMAGAGNNAVFVSDNGGNVGLGTSAPLLELQITDGNSPAIRLEQNGTSGFSPQSWDLAGNESNFIIRDVTNSSALPFRIQTGASDNTVSLAQNGWVGFGVQEPEVGFHFKSNDMYVDGGKVGIGTVPTSALDVKGTAKILGNQIVTGNSTFRGDISALITNSAVFNDDSNNPILSVDAINGRVGIGTSAPDHQLELTMDDAVKPGGGMWAAPSDRRLKNNIVSFTDGLSVLKDIEPVKFRYNGVLDYPTDKEFIGLIAQDVQKVASYAVKPLDNKYLAVDPSAFTYVLINSVKEQQELIENQQKEIEALKNTISQMDSMKAQLSMLSAKLDQLSSSTTEEVEEVEQTEDDRD